MLNPISDVAVESIFTTASSPIVSLQALTPIMTPSTIATITTSRDAPIPPTTIPSIILKNLPTFNSAFRFDERLRSLETTFSEYRQTNLFVDAVSAIPDKQRNLYRALVEAYDADKAILDTYGESTILKQRREDDDQEGPSAGSDRGSKRQKEGGEHASASTPSETAIGSAGRSITGSQSRQLSASESAFAEEPVQTTCQMEEPSHPVFETGLELSRENLKSGVEEQNLIVDVENSIFDFYVVELLQVGTSVAYDSFWSSERENNDFKNLTTTLASLVGSALALTHFERIEESVNATLEAEVLIRSSHSSRTLYAIAADLSEIELKKILIEKMEGNKSIQRSDEQRNLYKALVEAYDADKAILDTYGESTILKRRREDDDQEGPSARSDWGSKRQREGGEHASASTPSITATESAGRSTTGSQSRQLSASESAFAEEPVQTTCQMEEPSHPVFETGADDQPIVQTSQHPEWQTDARSSFNELLDTPIDFSNFIMNRLNVDTLTPTLLAGPTYELMRGSCNSLTELEYHLEEIYKATTDQLDWVNPEGQQYPHILLQPLSLIPDNRGRRVIPFDHFINNDLEYLRGGKLSNLTVEERFAFNVSLRMFTRRIVIQRRVEDLQLGVESYQKRFNLTKPDTYQPDLKRREAYTAYSNPRGFIYQNKDKKNRLMRIDELHKFSDGTLNDVCNALDDRLKGIQM
nr:hypothetical protein [Tanacetum cinerariifolium]